MARSPPAATDRPTNRFLGSLDADDLALLQPHLRNRELVPGMVLAERGTANFSIWWPHSGVISVVVRLETGAAIGVATIGHDGMFGTAAALDRGVALNTAIVHLAGHASMIDAVDFRAVFDQSAAFRAKVIRHEHRAYAQALQLSACNAAHTVLMRLSRWLLRVHDLTRDDHLGFTHEFLAHILGAQRNSISLAVKHLQARDLIRFRRGHIELLDIAGLRRISCECYNALPVFPSIETP